MKLTRRDLTIAVTTALATLASVAAADSFDPMPSTVYDWEAMPEQTTAVGARRPILRGETVALGELEAHVTTILPGNEPHAPHRHANEELIIVLRGTIEQMVEGRVQRIGAGSAVFLAPNDLHGIRNLGDVPASYYVLQMRQR